MTFWNVTKCHTLLNHWYKTTCTFYVWILLGTPLSGFDQMKCDLERDLRRDWPSFKSNVINLPYRKVVSICMFMLDHRLRLVRSFDATFSVCSLQNVGLWIKLSCWAADVSVPIYVSRFQTVFPSPGKICRDMEGFQLFTQWPQKKI